MTTDSVPLVFGSDDQFRALRSALAGLHYDEASICARTGVQSIFDFRTKAEQRETGIELKDALDALIHLLMDGETMLHDHLRSLAPAASLDVLESMGVLAKLPDQPHAVYATVFLYPVASLYIASDRGVAIDRSDITREREVVYPAITANTRRFLDSLPHTPCEEMLDLCSGSGIAAFVGAAGYAKHAWSCDLAERSVRFAEFNRRLNGIENVACLQGDLYQPVAGRTFDRITAHPPYVPSAEQEVLFRDGGADGEQVLRGVIAGLPGYLRVGGRCCCQSMATDREGESFEQRIRVWLGPHEREFDIFLVATYVKSKDEFLQHLRLNPKAANLEPLLTTLKVTSVYYGAVVLQRFAAVRAPITMRTRKAATAGAEAIDWLVRWMTAAAAPDFDQVLRQARPRLSPHLLLNVAHVVDNGALVPSRFELSSEFPFAVGLSGGWLAVLAHACDGKRTAVELLAELRQRDVIPAGTPEAQFLRDLRALISCGFLEIEEFAPPQKRT
jgi:methylase of polypeptide subunit release factors